MSIVCVAPFPIEPYLLYLRVYTHAGSLFSSLCFVCFFFSSLFLLRILCLSFLVSFCFASSRSGRRQHEVPEPAPLFRIAQRIDKSSPCLPSAKSLSHFLFHSPPPLYCSTPLYRGSVVCRRSLNPLHTHSSTSLSSLPSFLPTFRHSDINQHHELQDPRSRPPPGCRLSGLPLRRGGQPSARFLQADLELPRTELHFCAEPLGHLH